MARFLSQFNDEVFRLQLNNEEAAKQARQDQDKAKLVAALNRMREFVADDTEVISYDIHGNTFFAIEGLLFTLQRDEPVVVFLRERIFPEDSDTIESLGTPNVIEAARRYEKELRQSGSALYIAADKILSIAQSSWAEISDTTH